MSELAEELVAAGHAARVLELDLEVVVQIPDDAVAGGDGRGRPDEDVARVAPEDGRDEDAEEDERAAHRRRAALDACGVSGPSARTTWPICFLCSSRMNQGASEEGEEHRRDGGRDGAERHVAEDVEAPEPVRVVPQRKEQLVEHVYAAAVARAATSASTTRSAPTLRDAFTRTTSPGRTRCERDRAGRLGVSPRSTTSTPRARATSRRVVGQAAAARRAARRRPRRRPRRAPRARSRPRGPELPHLAEHRDAAAAAATRGQRASAARMLAGLAL